MASAALAAAGAYSSNYSSTEEPAATAAQSASSWSDGSWTSNIRRPVVVRPEFTEQVLNVPQQLEDNEFMRGLIIRKKGPLFAVRYEFHLDCRTESGELERKHCFTAMMARLKPKSAAIEFFDGGSRTIKYATARTPLGDRFIAGVEERITVKWKTGLKSTEQCDVEVDVNWAGGHMTLANRKADLGKDGSSYVLSFGKGTDALAKEPSVKNMQLFPHGAQEALAKARYIFGKMSADEFLVHFRQPFSSVDAFAMALTIFAESSK